MITYLKKTQCHLHIIHVFYQHYVESAPSEKLYKFKSVLGSPFSFHRTKCYTADDKG